MNAELWWSLGAAGFIVALIAAMTVASFLRTARLKRAIARERRDWELRSAQRRRTAPRSRTQTEDAARAPLMPTSTMTHAPGWDSAPARADIDEPAPLPLALDPMAGLAPLHPDDTSPAESAAPPAEPEPAGSADEQRQKADNPHHFVE